MFDVFAAALGILVTFPILALCMCAIWIDSRGPAMFRQWRVGQNGRLFKVLKLRSMIGGAEKQGPRVTASSDARITRVGKFLRNTKLDELPQLFNVLRGDMSIVGPRPEVPEYVAKYNHAERKVLKVRPGITGPASLAFIDEESVLDGHRNRESFYIDNLMRRKLQIDLAYCSAVSFRKDLNLLASTLKSVLISRSLIVDKRGALKTDMANAPRFFESEPPQGSSTQAGLS